MAYDFALYGSTITLLASSFWAYRFRLTAVNAVQYAWVALMCVPTALLYSGVNSLAKERQFTTTTIVNVALLSLVVLQSSGWHRSVLSRLRREVTDEPAAHSRFLPTWFYGLLVLSLATFIFHISLMPRVPLVDAVLRSDLTFSELAELREQANKTLAIPLPVKYVFNWNVRIFVPILLTSLIMRGGVYGRLVGAPLLLGFCSMTLEKSLPAFAVVSCGLAVAIYRRTSIVSRPVVMGLVVGLGLAAVLQLVTTLHGQAVPLVGPDGGLTHATSFPPSSRPPAGSSDTSRRARVEFPFQFVYRRVLRAPSEVAYAWFDYFPDVYGGFIHGRSWFSLRRSEPGFQHPAQLVGLYAYYRNDPVHYLPTIHAYGAFHADAWANFGYWGVLGASAFLVAILALVDLASACARSLLSAAASGTSLSILLTTLPVGGLQAALIAQGLIVCLAIMLSVIWQGTRNTRKSAYTSQGE